MNKFILFLVALFTFSCSGCSAETTQSRLAGSETHNKETVKTQSGNFTVEFQTNPPNPAAGAPTDLIFTVKNETGEKVKDFQIVHEKPMHLLAVSEDLSEFYHLHPEVQTGGAYKASFNFPNGGNYRLYADFTPLDNQQLVQSFPLNLQGVSPSKVGLKADSKLEKTVDNLRITMNPDSDLSATKELMLNFQVFDAATNKPVVDLENYLGAKAHFVVISQNLQDFVHAHPVSTDNAKNAEQAHETNGIQAAKEKPHSYDEKLNGEASQSIVSAHVTFPKAGLYKIFAQFQRDGQVVTVPFTVDVKEGEEEKSIDLSKVNFPKDSIKIIVSKNGFTPGEITYSQGKPLKLAFYRADSENCGSEVIFKDLHITKKLPVGEVVLIDIPTDTGNEFSFACGMNKMKGKIIVQ